MGSMEESKTEVMGRSLSEIPCFRQTFLYSIGSGMGVGLAYFLATSHVRHASHAAIVTYGAVTLGYWFYCRYNFSQQKFNMGKLQMAMQKKALYEGTEKDIQDA